MNHVGWTRMLLNAGVALAALAAVPALAQTAPASAARTAG